MIAVMHMVGSGLLLLVDGLILDNFDQHFEDSHVAISDDDVLTYNMEKFMRITDLLLLVFLFGFSVILLLGALQGKHKLVLSWVIMESIYYAMYVAKNVVFLIFGMTITFPAVAFCSVVTIYCLAAMVKFYEELKETRKQRMFTTCDMKSPLGPHFERI